MAHYVVCPQKKNYIPHFQNQRCIKSYFSIFRMVERVLSKAEEIGSKLDVGKSVLAVSTFFFIFSLMLTGSEWHTGYSFVREKIFIFQNNFGLLL
jgi:hypothetical protein